MSITPSDPTAGGGHVIDGSRFDQPLVHLPRRPLPLLVLAYAFGISLGVLFPAPPIVLAASIILCLTLGYFFPKIGTRYGGTIAAVVLMGWAFLSMHPDIQQAEQFQAMFGRHKQHVEVVGRIISQPQIVSDTPDDSPSVRSVVQLESIKRGHEIIPVSVRLRMNMMGSGDEPIDMHYGDRWRMRGILYLDEKPAMRSLGLAGFLNVYGDRSQKVEQGGGNQFAAWCFRMREACHERLGWGVGDNEPSASLTRALLLGYRKDVATEVHEVFAKTGTLHVLALSGMHVGVLILLLIVGLKATGIARPYWVLVFIPFLAVYTVGTGAASSTVRASVMAGVFFLSFLFRRQADSPSSMALAALLILLVDPFQLFDLGFVLSFTVVAGLIALFPVVMTGLKFRNSLEEWAEPESGWMASGRTWWKRIVEMFGVSLSAWLASLPLIATFFHLISPVALLVNLLLLPLVAVILFTSCLSLMTGVISAGAASVFNNANVLFCDLLVYIVEGSSKLPGAYRYVEAWPWFLMLLWYGMLVVCVVRHGRIRAIAAICLLLMTLLSMTGRNLSRSVEVVAIPTGRTTAMLIDGPGDRATLFDAGSSYGARYFVDTLRERGISKIDRVIISRATGDAYGGVKTLLDMMRVEQVIIPEVTKRQHAFIKATGEWTASTPALDVQYWADHAEIYQEGDVLIQLLHPNKNERYLNALDSSLMARVSRGFNSVLFMGHAGERIEGRAAETFVDWNADLVIAGKCNSSDAFGTGWLSLVSPRELVFNTRSFDRLSSGAGPLLVRLKSREGMILHDSSEKTHFVVYL